MKADLLLKNALLMTCASDGPLRGEALGVLTPIADGALAAHDGLIMAVGKLDDVEDRVTLTRDVDIIDCQGKLVLPGFIDCHTHLLHAGSRAEEYEMKLAGKSYEEILKAGGGIHSTALATAQASDKLLLDRARRDLWVMLEHGTTTVEMKSGYGLDYDAEMRILGLQHRLSEDNLMRLCSTHLAHVVPRDASRAAYLDEQRRIIADAAEEGLVDAFDVFCDRSAFTLAESRELCELAKEKGLNVHLHGEQLSRTGAAGLAVELGALSVDHLEHTSQKDIQWLADSRTVGVLLPAVSFHLGEKKLPPIKEMLEAGVALALATDYNPGSAPCRSMQMVIALASRLYGLSTSQAIGMATINAAHALGLQDEVGSLERGKAADIVIYDAQDHRDLVCGFGTNQAQTVIRSGKVVWER